MKQIARSLFISLSLILLASTKDYAQAKRIITLSGAISETVNALGLGKNIIAVDVTSVWPENINRLPKVSKNRSLSVESILSYHPDLILAPVGDLSKENLVQFKTMGVKVYQIKQEFSVEGSSKFIKQIASPIGIPGKGESLAKSNNEAIKKALNERKMKTKTPKILFVYARGSGTMSVAGKGSNMDAIITLAGGRNAIQEFTDFKPYTTESMIKSIPDIILMFDFGMSSLGGKQAVLQMPGVAYTNAGKSKKIIEMDGPLLINFSTRLPEAIKSLNLKIQ
ncbi:heme/hemin ABC transporter substrate-binding protein [Pedobacter sp. MW01-1-1]|uniref:heme/hemin ABC transporter substrate-binding protein n=1 Tax=Pedobacter sp. MW01-1-1 TaxID=3383027 RepID=UPI003FEDCBE5